MSQREIGDINIFIFDNLKLSIITFIGPGIRNNVLIGNQSSLRDTRGRRGVANGVNALWLYLYVVRKWEIHFLALKH